MPNIQDLISGLATEDLSHVPKPSWSRPFSLFSMPSSANTDDGTLFDYVCAGVPYAASSHTLSDAAHAPRAIREQSLSFGSLLDYAAGDDLFDLRTGTTYTLRRPSLVDAGDFYTFPTDPERNVRAIAAETYSLLRYAPNATLILLGGDHSVTIGTFAGVCRSLLLENHAAQVGYIHLDSHFDYGERSPFHGALFHGATARRVSEAQCIDARHFVFVGQSCVTRASQYESLKRAGYGIEAASVIRSEGAKNVAERVTTRLSECSAVYLSVDIDVLDQAESPGTDNLTIGGLTVGELLDTIRVLAALPIVAIDICEISPAQDPSCRTARIAARILFEYLCSARTKPS